MKYSILVVVIGLFIGSAVIFNSQVQAQENQPNFPNIIQRLADKFGLNVEDVQSVLEENRQERQAEMKRIFEEKLNQSVAEGELTEEQKNLILAKHQELQAQRQMIEPGKMRNMTQEERRAFRVNRQAQREELESWGKANGIDIKYFFRGMQRGMKGFGKY